MDENQLDKIIDIDIKDEMKKSYIDYAMSVIVARALPDVRDGLKPVHRRILFAMNELNLDPSKGYKKSARIVGDTMGKYHPHGDSSIYNAMVRMAQNFSMRYMLVDGHGNFGSIDGDEAAAQRYTEAKLSRIAMEILKDIDKDTVDFTPNYDEEFKEPTVLPARFPNLLVNGSSGIAVGMATNIPPHNINEIIDGILKIIDNKIQENRETDIEEIIDIIKGPDFPTGANILGKSGIKSAYLTGRGKIKVRATVIIEPISNSRDMIIIKELPYQVNKSKLVEKIGQLVGDKKVEGISDIRDESDRTGIRVVIELKKDVNANVILNQLYKYTQLQESFGVNMLALVKNEPKILNLKEVLVHYIEHQKEVIVRRTKFNLKKAEDRAHIIEGYLLALENIDEIITIIKASTDTQTAKVKLMERFSFSEKQTNAIVEMRLRSLTGLEHGKLQKEYNELVSLIKELKAILADETILYEVIKTELTATKDKYGDKRRTNLLPDPGEIGMEDLIDDETNVITLSNLDYIKRIPLDTYRSQNRGGRGVIGMQMRETDIVKNLFITTSHDYILFFTNMGRVFKLKSYEIPESGRTAKGVAIVNLLNLNKDEKISTIIPIRTFEESSYLIFVTKQGTIKKTNLHLYKNINKSGLIAIKFKENDELINVIKTDGTKELFIATNNGMGTKFNEEKIRPTARNTSGVRGIKLNDGDSVIGADYLEEDSKILFVSENGIGKCTETSAFTSRNRGGKGVKTYKLSEKTGSIVGVTKTNDKEELMLINSDGVIIRIKIADIATTGRITSGVKLINVAEGVKVIGIAKITEEQINEEVEEILVQDTELYNEEEEVLAQDTEQ
jgi:DNA gyrase subunit A